MVDGQITFGDFCDRCVHRHISGLVKPCSDCINTYVNVSREFPVNYDEDINKVKELGRIDVSGM